MRTILVVDDESSMRFLLRMILESAGYEVVEAPHGAAALERAKESPPDLVVTDLMMPVMNGRDLVGRLRADEGTAGIPIVMVTAAAGPEPGADALLMKPFEREELIELVDKLAGKES